MKYLFVVTFVEINGKNIVEPSHKEKAHAPNDINSILSHSNISKTKSHLGDINSYSIFQHCHKVYWHSVLQCWSKV